MAITLYTGLPGHGKTLRLLSQLKPLAEAEGRPVFHASGKPKDGKFGIPGLAIEGWQEHDPLLWFDLPANSYMVIDECQKVFPIRPRSAPVPKHVEELETHRHGGIDLHIVTQHPMLIDTNVRKLVDRHFHVVRKFGTKFATVYEFPTGVQDSPEKNRHKNGVVRHEWRYPKEVFDWYKSAEVHTVKARLPAKVWLVLGVVLLLPLLFWIAYVRLWQQHGMGAAGAAAAASAASSQVVAMGARSAPGAYRSPGQVSADYIAQFEPRIPGLAYTAPIYDQLTRPVEAPYPSVCMYMSDGPCRCWSQRGFSLPVPDHLCRTLAREPMDPYWLRRTTRGLEVPGASDGAGERAAPGARAAEIALVPPGAGVVPPVAAGVTQ